MTVLRIPYETIEKADDFLEVEVPDKNLMFQSIPNETQQVKDPEQHADWAVEATIENKKF